MAAESTEPVRLRRIAPGDVKKLSLSPIDDVTLSQASGLMKQVRDGGESALIDIALKFGDIKSADAYYLDKAELERGYNALPKDQQDLLQRVAKRIRVFAEAQRASIKDVEIPVPGGTAGHTVSPMATAGCYAPGGRYPLPSSVLMTAITARVAGVSQVIVASPRPAAITIGAAYVAGADALLAVGGAQAIAALAYGVGKVPACDVIVGPGNRWVTAAKSLLAGHCAIDMLAGPSECLVIADHTAKADYIAADLLAQAEHDTDALPILVTTSAELIDQVDAELTKQLTALPTRETAAVAVSKGFAVLCSDVDAAIAVSDIIAPEHLELQVSDAANVWKRIKNYGGIFIGSNTAEVFGDYGVGPNHVLPTSGTARYTGGLSVFTFLRIRTWLKADETLSDKEGLCGVIEDSAHLALLEGLHGHAAAASIRQSAI